MQIMYLQYLHLKIWGLRVGYERDVLRDGGERVVDPLSLVGVAVGG